MRPASHPGRSTGHTVRIPYRHACSGGKSHRHGCLPTHTGRRCRPFVVTGGRLARGHRQAARVSAPAHHFVGEDFRSRIRFALL